MTRWERFLAQVEADLRLWLFLCAYFFVFRAVFVGIFHARIAAPSDASDVVSALIVGMRYDAIVASYAVVIPLLGSLVAAFSRRPRLAERLRGGAATVVLALSALLCVVAVGYFREY